MRCLHKFNGVVLDFRVLPSVAVGDTNEACYRATIGWCASICLLSDLGPTLAIEIGPLQYVCIALVRFRKMTTILDLVLSQTRFSVRMRRCSSMSPTADCVVASTPKINSVYVHTLLPSLPTINRASSPTILPLQCVNCEQLLRSCPAAGRVF